MKMIKQSVSCAIGFCVFLCVSCKSEFSTIEDERRFALQQGELAWVEEFNGAIFIGMRAEQIAPSSISPSLVEEFDYYTDGDIVIRDVSKSEMEHAFRLISQIFSDLPEETRNAFDESVCQVIGITGEGDADFVFMNFFPQAIEEGDPIQIYRRIYGVSGGGGLFFRILHDKQKDKLFVRWNIHK